MSPSPSSSCPFCTVASSYLPFSPSLNPSPFSSKKENNDCKNDSPSLSLPFTPAAHLILSTKHVLAFLDTMPLTRGHVLVITRKHYRDLGEVQVQDAKELGKWLPILSRVVVRTILGDDKSDEDRSGGDSGHWNVVQNNGARASQTVPHVHFHIIPRPPLDGTTPTKGGWIMFGRGQRDDLDDDEAEELVKVLRSKLAKEVNRVNEEEGIDLDVDEDVDGANLTRATKL